MKQDPRKLEERIRKKSREILCNYKVIAVGINNRGEIIGITTNQPRSSIRDHHAEMRLMGKSPKNLSEIVIARLGKRGTFLPIDPCAACRRVADKRGIKIRSLP